MGKVTVYKQGDGNSPSTLTPGMEREQLVATDNAWVGLVSTEPNFISGWHHHGSYDTYAYVISGQIKMEFGAQGEDTAIAHAGEVLHVPKNTIHRESNPSNETQQLFVVRVGEGDPVTNVGGPES